MSGFSPTVTITLDRTMPYPAGGQLVAVAAVVDPDTTTETLSATDALGRATTITIARVDPATAVWSWKNTGATITSGTLTCTTTVPAASDTLVCTVTDGQGNAVAATMPVTVASTLVGVTMSASAFTSMGLTEFPGGVPYMRVYTPPGAGLYGWTSSNMVAALKMHPKCIHLSMKDTPTPGIVNPVLDGIPAGLVLRLTVNHEPEQGPGSGDPTLQQYNANWAALVSIVNAHPKRSQVLLSPILTLYAQLHGKGPWQQWIPPGVDEIGIDSYTDAVMDNNATSYPTGAQMFALLQQIMSSTGLPGLVPEYGSYRIASDTDGSGCAAMIAEHVAYVRSIGVRAIAWFDESPYAIEGRPAELAAWQRAVAGQ
jgi:hypothetical protein